MLKALVNDKAVISLDCIDRSLDYRCPGCGERVILKRGTKKVSHFAHEAHSACLFGAGETFEHLKAKAWLYQTMKKDPRCEEVDAECTRWPGIRPDVAYKLKSLSCWVGVEFQKSQISEDEIRARNIRYKNNGVILLWCVTEDAFWKISPRDADIFDEIRISDQIISFIFHHGGVFGFIGNDIAFCEYCRVFREGREFYNPYIDDWMESEGRLLTKTGAIVSRHKVDLFNLNYNEELFLVRDNDCQFSWGKVLFRDFEGNAFFRKLEDVL